MLFWLFILANHGKPVPGKIIILFYCHFCYCISYAATVGAKHYPTSAKLNKGLEEMFLDLTKRLLMISLLSKIPTPNRSVLCC